MVRLNIERYGKGKPIVFVHGSGWNLSLWDRQRDFLSRFFEVVLVDLPGHGKSEDYACESVGDYVDVLVRSLSEICHGPFFLAGHSLGGAIAIEASLTQPELLRGLIIIGSGARLRVLPKILEGLILEREKTIEFITEMAFSERADRALKELNIKVNMECPPHVIHRDFKACDKFDRMEDVKRIDLPCLIICGKDDRLTPPKYSHYLNQEIKGSKLFLIEDAGHMVMIEKPHEVNEAIFQFLSNLKD